LVSSNFDSIGTSVKNLYRDEGLTNGKNYCYYIKSYGAYSVKGVRQPLVNRSQELCATPLDNVPPCAPVLLVNNICTDSTLSLSDTSSNYLSWKNIRNTCATGKDVAGYQVFFATAKEAKFAEIGKNNFYADTTFKHENLRTIVGCYYVTAFDSLNNTSAASNIICTTNCPIYELPNTFTPNGDGQNDIFKPFATQRFVERVDFQVFNRWGGLVFKTEDPQLNWNGKNLNDQDLASSVYYYTCKVNGQILKGFIELIRNE
jgi:gliding motility-associated-like protein